MAVTTQTGSVTQRFGAQLALLRSKDVPCYTVSATGEWSESKMRFAKSALGGNRAKGIDTATGYEAKRVLASDGMVLRRMGRAAGQLVIDVDVMGTPGSTPDAPAVQSAQAVCGPALWALLQGADTFTVRTGSGGLHFYFALPGDGTTYKKAMGLSLLGSLPHVDIVAEGQAVVLPWSHYPLPGGRGLCVYTPLDESKPVRTLPPQLAALLERLRIAPGEDRPALGAHACPDRAAPRPAAAAGAGAAPGARTRAEPAPALAPTGKPTAQEVGVMEAVLKGYREARWKSYDGWIATGLALHHAGFAPELWDSVSKLRGGATYVPGACATKWATFDRKDGSELGAGSLWHWLKEDNEAEYRRLHQRTTVRDCATDGSHFLAALYFASRNPSAYIYNNSLGWLELQPDNTWLESKRTPTKLFNDVVTVLRADAQAASDDRWKQFVEAARAAGVQPVSPTAPPEKHPGLALEWEQVVGDMKLYNGYVRAVSSASFIKGVLEFLRGVYYKPDIQNVLNTNKDVFVFKDLVYDLKTGGTRPIEPTDYVTITTGYAFPRAVEPEAAAAVRAVLASLFENADIESFVTRLLAYALSGSRHYEVFAIFTGRGGNGKSLLVSMMERVLGGYAQALNPDVLTKVNNNPHAAQPELARMAGIRLVPASEVTGKLQAGIIKLWTGNDKVTARALYGDAMTFSPQLLLVLMCNDMPALSAPDLAMLRRLLVVHFPFQFVIGREPVPGSQERRGDPHLKEAVAQDAFRDAFVRLLLDVWETQVRGAASLNPPAAVTEAARAYVQENDAVAVWLAEHYELTGSPADRIRAKDLLTDFRRDTGDGYYSAQSLGRGLLRAGLSCGKSGAAYWCGLRRKAQMEAEAEEGDAEGGPADPAAPAAGAGAE